jgi:aminoglycoside phosphotransferase (APT) family kinase protein
MQEPKAARADYNGLTPVIREHGWPQGLELFAQRSFEHGYHISCDLWPRHASWKGLLSYAHRGSALVVESGCGTVALSIARDFQNVRVVPAVPEVLEGIRARVRYAGAENVTVAEALECSPGEYDAIALSGVSVDYLNEHLVDIAASLRPHGSMYIAFESPRVNSIHAVLSPPLHRITRKLRRRFDDVTAYWYVGSLTQASELRATGRRQPRWKSRVGGLLAPYVGGTFGITATMSKAGPSLFEEVLEAAGRNLEVERYAFAHPAGISLIVRDRATRQRSIIRIPADDHSVQRAHTNFDNVNLLHRLGVAPAAIPVEALQGEVYGQRFFMEHMLDGRNLHRTELQDPSLYAAVTADAARRLTMLHQATARAVELTPSRLEHLIGDILRKARIALVGDKGRHVLPEVEAYLFSTLAGRRVNLVFFHGDYTYDNLMFDPSGQHVTGMFDWDLSRPDSLPLLDLLYFLITAERGHTGNWVPSIFADRLKHGFRPVEQDAVNTYCRALNVPQEIVVPLLILTCLHHLGVRMHNPEPYAVFDSYWTEFLEALPETIQRNRTAGVL